MANDKNGTKDQIIQKEEKAFRLREKGWSQLKIAEQLNMTQQGVSKALKRITKRFSQRFLQNVSHAKYEQVAQLEHIAHEAMIAWYNSKNSIKPKRGRACHQFGDPRFLMVFRKAKEDIRNILGTDAFTEESECSNTITAIKINIIGPDGRIMNNKYHPYNTPTDDEVQ